MGAPTPACAIAEQSVYLAFCSGRSSLCPEGTPDMEFDKAALLDAFDALGRAAWAEGATIEIAVYGGRRSR
jgi:hypothetical protein